MSSSSRSRPLQGIRAVEFGGLGPGPFGAMMLADLGADVVRIERPRPSLPADAPAQPAVSPLFRGRRQVHIDLKDEAGLGSALELIRNADVVIDPYRPGAMEALGLGPKRCLSENGRLVYAQITGWGQEGPLAPLGGHDINYLAFSGALSLIGEPERPSIPLNLIADYGGGGMLLVTGILSALFERERSGRGQVVDTAMVDGVALLMSGYFGARTHGLWPERRTEHILNGAAPFYNVYATSDGRHVAVGAMEPMFYRRLRETLGLSEDPIFADQFNRENWPAMKQTLAETFGAQTLEHWTERFDGVDACVTPVLTPSETLAHPHATTRRMFAQLGDVTHPVPGPHLSDSSDEAWAPSDAGAVSVDEVLADWSAEATA